MESWEYSQMKSDFRDLERQLNRCIERLNTWVDNTQYLDARLAQTEDLARVSHERLEELAAFMDWMQQVHPQVIEAYRASTQVAERME